MSWRNMLTRSIWPYSTVAIFVLNSRQLNMHWSNIRLLSIRTRTCSLVVTIVFQNIHFLPISVVVKTAEEKQAVDEQIREKVEMNPLSRNWSCRQCGYSHHRKEVVYKHVDTKHMDMVYRCDYCHKLTPTQHALKEHMRTNHKDSSVISSYPTY